jgi:hypothetical protein
MFISDGSGGDYKWDADTPDSSTVTLTHRKTTLNGKITALQTTGVAVGTEIVIEANSTLTIAGNVNFLVWQTLTVADGGAVILTGGDNPAQLLLVRKIGTPAAGGGGGKLVLTGGDTATTALGTNGVIKPAATLTTDNLTATGPTTSGTEFIFTGTTSELGTTGFTNIDNTTAKGFTSIEAATVTEDSQFSNVVIFKGGATTGTTATINKNTKVKTSAAD